MACTIAVELYVFAYAANERFRVYFSEIIALCCD